MPDFSSEVTRLRHADADKPTFLAMSKLVILAFSCSTERMVLSILSSLLIITLWALCSLSINYYKFIKEIIIFL